MVDCGNTFLLGFSRVVQYVGYLPPKKKKKNPHPRIFAPYAISGGKTHTGEASEKIAKAADRVITPMLVKKFRVPIQFFPKYTAQKIQNEFFVVKYIPNKHPHHRFGLVVSTKVAKRASLRNQIRRTLMMTLSQKYIRPRTVNGFDVLIVVSPRIVRHSLSEVAASLSELISHLNV